MDFKCIYYFPRKLKLNYNYLLVILSLQSQILPSVGLGCQSALYRVFISEQVMERGFNFYPILNCLMLTNTEFHSPQFNNFSYINISEIWPCTKIYGILSLKLMAFLWVH